MILDGWLMQANQSEIVELQRFVTGIRHDYAAVRADFSSPWNNGQVEAQVNCLKRKPRLLFGRARFDLLRQRVLSRAYLAYCSAGTTPSCCNMPSWSNSTQASTILPPLTRTISIPVTVTGLPVGGMP